MNLEIGDLIKVVKIKEFEDSDVNVDECFGETGRIVGYTTFEKYGKMYEIEFDNTDLPRWNDGLHFHEDELERINKESVLLRFIESYLEIEMKPYQKMILEGYIKDLYM